MIIKLLDRDETYLRNVEVWKARRRQVVNGEHTLEFETQDMAIEEGHRIIYREPVTNRWREFIVTDVDDAHDRRGLGATVYAEDSFYETLGDWINDRRLYNTTATAALQAALDTTRWEVGHVDDLGIASTNYYRENPKEAVQKKLLKAWGGKFDTRIEVVGNRITHRYVDIKKQIGAVLGKRFVYDKDMVEVKRSVTMTDFCTALYGFGKGEEIFDESGESTGGYGRRIDFGDINGGVAYLENITAREKYGYVKNGVRQHIYGKVEFDDITDREILKAETQKVLDARSVPQVTYSCKVIDLRKHGMDFEGVGLDDTVLVIDNDLDIRVLANVVEYVDYPDEEAANEITLGNYRRLITDNISATEDYINAFRSRQGVWDRADIISENGIPASYIDGILAELNEQANQSGGWVFMEPGGGLISYNAATPEAATEAVQIIGGTVRIANQKNADGSWRWRTFFTGSQVVADVIRTGILQGGKVRFNLDDGTFLVGNSTTDYQLYWDGSQLKINGNLLVDEINLSGGRIQGEHLTLDGDVTVLGSFSVPGSSLFGTINANTINVTNLTADNMPYGTVQRPYDYGPVDIGSGNYNLNGNSINVSGNSSYITMRDTGGRGQLIVDGTIGARGSTYYYEINGGGYYGGTAQGAGRALLQTTGTTTWLNDGYGSTALKISSSLIDIDRKVSMGGGLEVTGDLVLRGQHLSLGSDGNVKWKV